MKKLLIATAALLAFCVTALCMGGGALAAKKNAEYLLGRVDKNIEKLTATEKAIAEYAASAEKQLATGNQLELREERLSELKADMKLGRATQAQVAAAESAVTKLKTEQQKAATAQQKAALVIADNAKLSASKLADCELADIYFVLDPQTISEDNAIEAALDYANTRNVAAQREAWHKQHKNDDPMPEEPIFFSTEDENAIVLKVKDALLSLSIPYGEAKNAAATFRTLIEGDKAVEQDYKLGKLTIDQYTDAKCALFAARGDVYTALGALTAALAELNALTGGFITIDHGRFVEIYAEAQANG